MNIYVSPINLEYWNIFANVAHIGHTETFLATKSMEIGDILLLYVGKNKDCPNGVYAIAEVIKPPYITIDNPNDYCYNKLSVIAKITKINRINPIISFEQLSMFNNHVRSTHRINERYISQIISLID